MTEPQAGRVTVEYDVVFGHGGGRDLKCNVYMPPQQGSARPAVLLIHGGGWVSGDRSQLHGYGILLGRIGYVCVTTEYRLAGEAKWPAQLHDVKAALRWMRANADRLGIDQDKISVEGNSAGAHLSLMVAGTQNVAAFEGDGGNAGVRTDVAALREFRKAVTGITVIRSVELVAVAFELGLLDEFITQVPNARKELLESVLWGVKLHGASVSEEEIAHIVKSELKGA